MLKRIGFALLCISLPMISSAQSEPTTADGLFGQYFLNMVKPCGNNTQVVTGFNKTSGSFGQIICTNITDILNKIDGTITIGRNVIATPGAMVTIKGPVATTHEIKDTDHPLTLVTKEYVDTNFSQVDAGSVLGTPGQTVSIIFNKKFKNPPAVIAIVENFHYQQKKEQRCWQEKYKKRWWGNHKTRTVCVDFLPEVHLDLGAKVTTVSEKGATIQISPKVSTVQGANVKWIAVSNNSALAPLVSLIGGGGGASSESVNEYIEQKKRESEEAMAEREAELETIESEFEKLRAQAVPPKAIMPFYAAECPTGWVRADGRNGTPDLRGEFIRGVDAGRGVDPNRGLGSWQNDKMAEHYHGVGGGGHSGDITFILGAWYSNKREYRNTYHIPGESTRYTMHQAILRAGNTGYNIRTATQDIEGGETRPRNVALLYCMKQ